MTNTHQESSCYACDLSSGTERLIGGRIHETEHWLVEHCMGPLGVGTLIVKPKRHVLHVWELSAPELAEMGPLIGEASAVVKRLTDCDQVYVCLWSHAGFEPVHIHYVVQPVSNEMRTDFEFAGPALQMDMFRRGNLPDPSSVEEYCRKARSEFGSIVG